MKYIELNNYQKSFTKVAEDNLIDYILKSEKHCIIHGFAGSGKSTLIRKLAEYLGDRCLKLAPTGNTAYNIDGTTLDSLLSCYGWSPNSTLKNLERYSYIVLDEISMTHSYKLDALFSILDCLNKGSKRARLILIGDPFQLPPVVTNNMVKAFSEKARKIMSYDDFYFFKSEHFQDNFNKMECFLLTKNHRQTDTVYDNILKKIAQGLANQDDLEYINQRVVSYENGQSVNEHPIVVPTRNGVRLFNKIFLKTCERIFTSVPVVERKDDGYDDIELEHEGLLEPLNYSIGAPVVFTQNDLHKRWVNGTKGFICKNNLDNYENTCIEIRTDRDHYFMCEQTKYRLQRFVFIPNNNRIENETVAIIRQFPFILGYAITVHRAQGMTLNSMAFNTGEGLFSPGQLYVALSRVRKLDDLILHVPLNEKDIIVSDNVNAYFDAFKKRCISVL
jgi:ATP-dependent exoDNAse (exonuclease V) alpha subunit